MDRYFNPFTDFGFKKLFGEEMNKDLLLHFLNALLSEEQGEIVDVQYLKNEQLGRSERDRRAVFDIYCRNLAGERFIVEMQKAKQDFFKERSVFYASFPIQEQGLKGAWNFDLKAVYSIGILDFVFAEDAAEVDKYHYKIKLTDIETCRVFYDKLMFVYLEMPKFKKTEEELETDFDKWLYVLKQLPNLEARPAKLQERVFERVFETAEIAKFTPEERDDYEQSLKYYRDLNNVISTAKREGKEEGVAEGIEIGKELGKEQGIEIGKEQGIEIGKEQAKLEMIEKIAQAKALAAEGKTVDEISALLGLSPDLLLLVLK